MKFPPCANIVFQLFYGEKYDKPETYKMKNRLCEEMSMASEDFVTTRNISNSKKTIFFSCCKKVVMAAVSCFCLSIPSAIRPDYPPPEFLNTVVGPFPLPLMDKTALFPLPDKLRSRVDFWKKIFSDHTSAQVVIHDNWYLSIVYEVIEIGKFSSRRKIRKAVKAARQKYGQLLKTLPWDTPEMMTTEEYRIYSLFDNITEIPRFKKKDAAYRVRSQRGIADSFKAGLIIGGGYFGAMRQIFAEYGLPKDIVYLTMIESTFNVRAESHAKAKGIWQFMAGTAKQYDLKIGNIADERRDPLLATVAAARFLKDNYKMLKSWPLAITAYNFGAGGMRNASKVVNSTEITDILEQYDGPRFEFASRNFYVEFLASREICRQYEKYFGNIELEKPLKIVRFKLPDHISVKTLGAYLGIPTADIRKLNPALNSSVFTGEKFVPRDYCLNLPAKYKNVLAAKYESIPDSLKYVYVSSKKKWRVRKRQTLSEIAKAHNSTVREFRMLNGISNSRKIRAGQWLKVPGTYVSKDGKPSQAASSAGSDISEKKTGSREQTAKREHRVRKGQTLKGIAKIYKTSVRAIAMRNSIRNPQHIRYGQILEIPEDKGISKN